MSHTVGVRLSDRQLGRLDALAEARGTSRSETLRRLVEEASVEISPPTALPVTKPMTVDEMALILADVARSAGSMRVRAEAIRLMKAWAARTPCAGAGRLRRPAGSRRARGRS
jgi:Ribbon-helix-helix protein, copG family